jgi:myo-inositol 2-dehydrogenase/D-chiro-inositol 1-dehydrogenase
MPASALADNDVVGIGIVGAGIMGADHARILQEGVAGARLVGIQDTDRERAERVAVATQAARVFETAEQLIGDPAVDAVLIAAPDASHAPLTIACIAQGKPVLCEKPLAATLDECRDILAREMAGGRRLVQVGYMRRFDPGYSAMKRSLEDGRLGAPLMMHCVHRNAVAPDYVTAERVIPNSMVHEFDIARFILGEEFVSAMVASPRASRQAPARQPQFVVLETPSGVVVDIESFLDCQYGYDVRAELVCEAGSISLAPNPPIAVRQAGRDGFALNPDWRGRFVDAYREQMRAWVASVRTGRASIGSSAWDGFAASAIAAACMEARRAGGKMRIDLGERPAFYG